MKNQEIKDEVRSCLKLFEAFELNMAKDFDNIADNTTLEELTECVAKSSLYINGMANKVNALMPHFTVAQLKSAMSHIANMEVLKYNFLKILDLVPSEDIEEV